MSPKLVHHVAGLALVALLASCAPGLEPVRLRVPPERVVSWRKPSGFPHLICGGKQRKIERVHRIRLVDQEGRRFPLPRSARLTLAPQVTTITLPETGEMLHLQTGGLKFAEIDARVRRVRGPVDWLLGTVAVVAVTVFVGFFVLFTTTAE